MQTTPRAGQIETAFGPIGYAAAGHGPKVVLLHGNPGDGRDFDAVAGALAQRHTVIRVDWPGYGRSPGRADKTASAPALARLLDEIIRALGGDTEQVTLIGHSVGGYAAASQALARPERVAALVLVAPSGFTRFNGLTRSIVRIMGSVRLARRLVGPLATAYTLRRTPAGRAALHRARATKDNPRRLEVHSAIWRSLLDPAHDLRDSAAAITVPVLLLWGRFDPVVPWFSDGRRAARSLPHAQVIRLWSGHLPHAEVPDRWLHAVVPFLDAALDQGPAYAHG